MSSPISRNGGQFRECQSLEASKVFAQLAAAEWWWDRSVHHHQSRWWSPITCRRSTHMWSSRNWIFSLTSSSRFDAATIPCTASLYFWYTLKKKSFRKNWWDKLNLPTVMPEYWFSLGAKPLLFRLLIAKMYIQLLMYALALCVYLTIELGSVW